MMLKALHPLCPWIPSRINVNILSSFDQLVYTELSALRGVTPLLLLLLCERRLNPVHPIRAVGLPNDIYISHGLRAVKLPSIVM